MAEKAALEEARCALHIQATHDSLTGIYNRAAMLEQLEREIARATRDQTPLGVLIADLDHFKNLNDSYGHLCGDDVIREAAERFREAMRAYDWVGRYGGEEFLDPVSGLGSGACSGTHRRYAGGDPIAAFRGSDTDDPPHLQHRRGDVPAGVGSAVAAGSSESRGRGVVCGEELGPQLRPA